MQARPTGPGHPTSATRTGGLPRSLRRSLSVAVAAAMTAGTLALGGPAHAGDVTRISGDDRVATSISVFEQNRKVFTSDTVIITRSNDYADALTATPLAAALNAAVLSTGPDGLDERVLASLKAQGIKNVIIVGGESAVSSSAADALKDAGLSTERIAGASRYDTALKVAEKVMEVKGTDSVPVFLATGTNFADALAAGAAAASQGAIVLLSQGPVLDKATAEFLTSPKTKNVVAVGGPAAEAMADARVEGRVIKGTDRYDTAAKLAQEFYPNPSSVVLTSGETYADSLAGAALAALTGAPMVLTTAGGLSPQTKDYLSATKADVVVLGGAKTIPPAVSAAVTDNVAGPRPAPPVTPPTGTTNPPTTTQPGGGGNSGGSGGGSSNSSVFAIVKDFPAETKATNDGRFRLELEVSGVTWEKPASFVLFQRANAQSAWTRHYSGNTGGRIVSGPYPTDVADGTQFQADVSLDGSLKKSRITTIRKSSATAVPTITINVPDASAVLPNDGSGVASPVEVTVGGQSPTGHWLDLFTEGDGTPMWGTQMRDKPGHAGVYEQSYPLRYYLPGTYALGYSFTPKDPDVYNGKYLRSDGSITVIDPAPVQGKKSVEVVVESATANPGAATKLTASVVKTGTNEPVTTGSVQFFADGYPISWPVGDNWVNADGDGSDGWTANWVPRIMQSGTTQKITARYTATDANPTTSTTVTVEVPRLDLNLTVPTGDYQDYQNAVELDPIVVGADTVPLRKEGTEVKVSAPQGYTLQGWTAWVDRRQVDVADPQLPVVTIDGDDNRVRLSAPAGTTPGEYWVSIGGWARGAHGEEGRFNYTYWLEVKAS